MPKRKKLVERLWAIRLASKTGGEPFFVLTLHGTAKTVAPHLFPTRDQARGYKRRETAPNRPFYGMRLIVVPVDLNERQHHAEA
jgi:hypothetical protein